jgi:hypothetical protein
MHRCIVRNSFQMLAVLCQVTFFFFFFFFQFMNNNLLNGEESSRTQKYTREATALQSFSKFLLFSCRLLCRIKYVFNALADIAFRINCIFPL